MLITAFCILTTQVVHLYKKKSDTKAPILMNTEMNLITGRHKVLGSSTVSRAPLACSRNTRQSSFANPPPPIKKCDIKKPEVIEV